MKVDGILEWIKRELLALTHPASSCLVPRHSEPPPGKSQEGNVLVSSKRAIENYPLYGELLH